MFGFLINYGVYTCNNPPGKQWKLCLAYPIYDQCLQKNLVVGVCWGINLAEVRCCWHFCKCVNTVRNMESRNENSMVLFAVQSFINVSVCIKINKLVFQIYFRFENTV